MKDYKKFLESKIVIDAPSGHEPVDMNPQLFDFQKDLVSWAVRRGRAAIFADCGLGKTPMQLEWARQVQGDVIILAPLAVTGQTVLEGQKFGLEVTPCRSDADVRPGINITNYEMMEHFDFSRFNGMVLDESSILKSYDGKTRKLITSKAKSVPYRLACTATPAPNDLIEIINHAEYLGIMGGKEIIALFFTQDGNTTHNWRLKGHARNDFWKWLASWATALRRPSDLGYEDADFVLPKLQLHSHIVDVAKPTEGFLFALEAVTLQERLQARRDSTADRVAFTAEMVNQSADPFLIWCNLNSESDALKRAIPGSVEVKGADSIEHKEKSLIGFSKGDIRVIITKPTIAGFGLNWQHCNNMAFVGLSDSFEQYYQAVRRCWRFGQKKPVNVHIVTAQTEGMVTQNIERKEREAGLMMDNLVKEMSLFSLDRCKRDEMTYREDVATGEGWTLHLGDSVLIMDHIPENSIGMSVFSPPFPGMYAYTNSKHDIGNTKNIEEALNHLRYVMGRKLLRITMPGRSACVHLTQAVAFKGADGYIGIKDFRGRVIELMEAEGWIYYGEVCIDKNPQVKAIRTKDQGLLFKSLATDASRMHMALADYLLQFRKPGDNLVPIKAGISEKYDNMSGWITANEWIEWAAPVWYRQTEHYPGGIKETDVLNGYQKAKDADDEKHLCPLQLGVIERAVKLWSNPGETVFSPFAGVGSEGYQSLRFNRKFIGIELKESYWKQAVLNLRQAETLHNQDMML